jgi:mycothiol synthase
MMKQLAALAISADLLQYEWRSARREDALAIHELLVDIEAEDHRGWVDTLDDRQRDFDDPATNIETDTLLAFAPDGRLAALGWIIVLPPGETEHVAYLWGEVHPQHRRRGLGTFMLRWMERRAREILDQHPRDRPHNMRSNMLDTLTDRIALYEQEGFTWARSYYRMRRDLSLPIPEVRLPPGISLRVYTPDMSQATMQAIDEAFIDHWGHAPLDMEAWELFFVGTPSFRPEMTYLAMTDDGQVAGVCFNEVHEEENLALNDNQGWIRDLAVRRPWRKQGLGTALMCASMQAFRQAGLAYAGLGVDAENLTGALRIYEQLGFTVAKRYLAYSKTV